MKDMIKKVLKYIYFTIILLMFISPLMSFAKTTTIYSAPDTKELCSAISSQKLKIGIHSFYNETDTVLENTTNACSNTAYFTNNLSEKTEGENYPSWTNFARASASYKQYIEDIDVTNADEYRYLYIQNRFQAYSDNKLRQSYTLKAGESIFLDIDLDNKINISDYNDLRITLNYGLVSGDIDIIRFNSITYYVIDENNKKYGPYRLGDADYVKRIVNKGTSSTQTVDEYKLVSENLKDSSIPTNTKIKKVRIVPYENRPIQSGAFRIFSISLDGYSSAYTNNKDYISVSNASVKIRQNITNNMATNATIKWRVNSARSLKFYCSLCGGDPKTFDSDHVYYGMPYVNSIDATYYSFLSHTTKQDGIQKYNFATQYVTKETSSRGIEVEGETTNPLRVYETGSGNGDTRTQQLATFDYVPNKESNYFPGQDCSSSVFYANGKELPYVNTLALSTAHLTSYHVKLLGGLESNYSEVEQMLRNNNLVSSNERVTDAKLRQYHTAYIKKKYTDQEIYNAYGLLQPGDSLVMDGHVRMETGYPHVECNDGTTTNKYTSNYCSNHGGINGKKSYVVTTEVRGTHVNLATKETREHVSQGEAGWTMTPDSNYTDVTNIDSLYQSDNTKIVSFRFNTKYYFSVLYGVNDTSTTFDPETGIELENATAMYLPYRYKELDKVINTNKIEKPEVKFIIDQDYEANLLNAKLYNYIKNEHKLKGQLLTNYVIDKIKIKINSNSYYIYPNQTNRYYLDSDLQNEDILKDLNKLNYNDQNIISIGVYMGPNIPEVKNSLSLDNEGFINVITITTPKNKITPTFEVQKSIDIESGKSKTVSYTYDGDGEITCTSANKNIVTCSVNNQDKKVTLTHKSAGTTSVTLTASEGEIYASTSVKLNVQCGESFAINHYSPDYTNNQISSIELQTNLETYRSHFTIPAGYTISVELNDKSYIFTGSITTVKENNTEKYIFTNIVLGDINGDGLANSGDLLKIRQHLLNKSILKNIYFTAGDVTKDSAINSADLLRMRQYLLGKATIS